MSIYQHPVTSGRRSNLNKLSWNANDVRALAHPATVSATAQSQEKIAQLRLQLTVEGLSVAAVTYYIVGLVGYVAKALKSAGWTLNPDVMVGISIPLVALMVALGIRRIHRGVAHTR